MLTLLNFTITVILISPKIQWIYFQRNVFQLLLESQLFICLAMGLFWNIHTPSYDDDCLVFAANLGSLNLNIRRHNAFYHNTTIYSWPYSGRMRLTAFYWLFLCLWLWIMLHNNERITSCSRNSLWYVSTSTPSIQTGCVHFWEQAVVLYRLLS